VSFNWREHLEDAMRSTCYCCLSTKDAEGIWANPVYFAYDAGFNIYFISMPASRHMKAIGSSAPIAVAIYATDQPAGGDVKGIQLSGFARVLDDDEVAAAAEVYYGRAGAAEAAGGTADASKHLGDSAVWKFVKVIPEEIYYFDTRFFDEEKEGRQLVPKEIYRD